MQIKLHDLNSNFREILPENLTKGPFQEDNKPVRYDSIQKLIGKQIRLPVITANTTYPLTATLQPVVLITE